MSYILCNVTLHREEKYNFAEHLTHYCLYWHLSQPQPQRAGGQLNGLTRLGITGHLVRPCLGYEESLATETGLRTSHESRDGMQEQELDCCKDDKLEILSIV